MKAPGFRHGDEIQGCFNSRQNSLLYSFVKHKMSEEIIYGCQQNLISPDTPLRVHFWTP
jgi:hypothetical protein